MSHSWTQSFLRALASGCTVVEAASAAGITSQTAYVLKRKDADFGEAWRLALEDSADILEREARRRAVEGAEEPVVYQGQLTPVWEYGDDGQVVQEPYEEPLFEKDPDTGHMVQTGTRIAHRGVQARNPDGSLKWLTVRKPSDALLALMLKGRRKEVFGTDRTELTGRDGAPLQVDDVARRARIAAIVAAAKDRADLA
jgi:hypothetical protein